METLEDAFEYEHALVFGIGGSGDVVGCIPTARLLETFGVEVTLGGMTWEPVPYDTKPGPRALDEVENVRRLTETVGMASGRTRTTDGLVFTESLVAEQYDEEVMLIGMSGGVRGMIRGLEDACRQLGVGVIIGVDAGGDALARGDEPGLQSPVTDGYGVATLDGIGLPASIGVFGYGSDGELTLEELDTAMAYSASRDGLLGSWGVTRRVRAEMEAMLDHVDTEASRLPVEAARGEVGQRTIRGGSIEVDLRIPSSVTFYFRPETVAEYSTVSRLVRDSRSLDEATRACTSEGMRTEFDIERERLADSSTSAS